MNQFHWDFVANTGNRYKIGIVHSALSGNLLIHCNNKIMVIDFLVKRNKTYALFIDDELCEISIEKKDGQYYYDFNINTEADTPLNRSRKILNRKYAWQTLAFFSGLILVTAIFLIGFKTFNYRKIEADKSNLLNNEGQIHPAVFIVDSLENGIEYSFTVEGLVFNFQLEKDRLKTYGAMPLRIQSGDEFKIRVVPYKPVIHEILWDQPTSKTYEKYMDIALEKELEYHPASFDEMVRCSLDIAYELRGFEGILAFVYQDKLPDSSKKLDKNEYLKIVRSVPFKQLEKERCTF